MSPNGSGVDWPVCQWGQSILRRDDDERDFPPFDFVWDSDSNGWSVETMIARRP